MSGVCFGVAGLAVYHLNQRFKVIPRTLLPTLQPSKRIAGASSPIPYSNTIGEFSKNAQIQIPNLATKSWLPRISLQEVTKLSKSILENDFFSKEHRPTDENKKTFVLQSSNTKIPNYGFLNINRNDRVITIGLRGSRVLDDWRSYSLISSKAAWDDVLGSKVETECLLHKGFKDLSDKLHPQISKHLKQEFGSDLDDLRTYAVYISGHSLGGAVAQISALNLYYDPEFPFLDYGGRNNARNQFKVVAYSSPKVFSHILGKKIDYPLKDENLLRIHLTGDPFPSFPLRGFAPVGEGIVVPLDSEVYSTEVAPKRGRLGMVQLPATGLIYHRLDVLHTQLEKWENDLV